MSLAVLGFVRIVATRAMVRIPPRTSKKLLTFMRAPQAIFDLAAETQPLTMAESTTPSRKAMKVCRVK
jgi:hypothetical protein